MEHSGYLNPHTGELITQVLAVDRHECGLPVALTDEPLDASVIWSHAHITNRDSQARTRKWLLVRRSSLLDITKTTDVILVWLPRDLRMGDLLAMPRRSHPASTQRIASTDRAHI